MPRPNLKTMRDELRLRLHLAEMEAKSTWERLVPKAIHKLRTSWRSLKGRVETAGR